MFPGSSAMVLMASALYVMLFGLTCGEAVGVATSVQLHKKTIMETIEETGDVRGYGHDHGHVYTLSQVDLRGFRHKRKVDTKVVHKTAYFGTVEIGTQRQPFEVVFDSGSGNLLVPASDCDSEACFLHNRYNQTKSPKARRVSCNASNLQDSQPASIDFGTGTVTGRCVEDHICVGTVCYPGSFIAITSESKFPFASVSFDGVLGLALPQFSCGPRFNAMERLKATESLHQGVFAVFLSSAEASSEVSEITFGSIKTSHMASDLHWVPVARDSGYWEVKIDDITIDDRPQDLCANCHVAVDTGTSELAGPGRIIQELDMRLNVQPDCSNFHQLPRLGFLVGGQILNLEPAEYVDETTDNCGVSLMTLDIPPPKGPLFIFGIPFLEKFYTVYDSVNNQIGFAVAKHASNASMPPALIMSQLDASVKFSSSSSSRGVAQHLSLSQLDASVKSSSSSRGDAQRDHRARGFLRK